MKQSTNLPPLPQRPADSHKGNFGRVLLVGGSVGMSGAIALSGMAALRSGAGLVSICTPTDCWATVAAHEPSYMTIPASCDSATGTFSAAATATVLGACSAADCIGCGPGLRCNSTTTALFVTIYQQATAPMVVDADGLNCLAASGISLSSAAPRVLTPHVGEFRRLMQQPDATPEDCRNGAAEFARTNDCVVVLKGHESLVTDGDRVAINPTGNPGMATGGTGDVLTGVIAALIGQGLTAYESAVLGTHLHGLAGDLAASELGQHSLIASDLVRFLPAAFKQHNSNTRADAS